MENQENKTFYEEKQKVPVVPLANLVDETIEELELKNQLKCKSYEIYKKSVGGITMNGEAMKELAELPMPIQQAWREIDWYYMEETKRLHKKIISTLLTDLLENYFDTKEEEQTS